MLGCLVILRPLDPVTGSRVELRVSAHNDSVVGRRINGLGDHVWEPALVTPPTLRQSLFDGSFQASVSPAAATLPVNMMAVKSSWPNADRYAWAGATVEIMAEDHTKAWPWPPRFKGKVASFSRAGQVLNLQVSVDTEPFAVDGLTLTYAGTGGAEGPIDLKGRVKPLVLGWAMNVEPVLIDATNSVYQFSGYGVIEAVTTLFERGSAFGTSTGNYATYAALVAATIPRGGWGSCLAEGMIRLGAPAYGVITGDIKGHVVGSATPRRTGAMIAAIADLAGVDPALIDADSLAALDAAVPYPVNRVISAQETVLALAQGMALPCNAQAGVSINGKLFVSRVSFLADQQMLLDARGRSLPQVTDSREDSVSAPFWQVIFGANRAWRVHSTEEVAFASPIVPVGLYSNTAQYREGQVVSLADGSEWLYIAVTPGTGNAPPAWPTTSNAWWSNIKPPLTADGLTYADGTPIEDLKPAEPGSDVTANTVPRHDPMSGTATFTANHTGAVDAGQLPKNIGFKRYLGTTDVTDTSTWSIVSQGSISGGTVTVTNGLVAIPSGCAIPLSTVIQVKSARDGFDIISNVAVTRLDAPPPSTGGGGTTVTDNTLNNVSNTTKIALSDVMTVKTGAAGAISFAGSLSIIAAAAAAAGSFGVAMRWKWRAVGGSFADVGGSDIAETVAATVIYDAEFSAYFNEDGTVDVTASQTGLSAATDYEVQLWGARSSASPTKTIGFGGTVSATGS